PKSGDTSKNRSQELNPKTDTANTVNTLRMIIVLFISFISYYLSIRMKPEAQGYTFSLPDRFPYHSFPGLCVYPGKTTSINCCHWHKQPTAPPPVSLRMRS